MTAVRAAIWLIGRAYALLALAIVLFFFAIHERADTGSVFAATVFTGLP